MTALSEKSGVTSARVKVVANKHRINKVRLGFTNESSPNEFVSQVAVH
jgi:hypothetical protein